MPLATLTFSSQPSNTSTRFNPNSTAVAGPRLVTRFPKKTKYSSHTMITKM